MTRIKNLIIAQWKIFLFDKSNLFVLKESLLFLMAIFVVLRELGRHFYAPLKYNPLEIEVTTYLVDHLK